MNFPKYPAYKDSGVEWIGKIPEGWNVRKLKYVIKNFVGGGTPSTSYDDYWDGDIPWVSISDITNSGLISNTGRMITLLGKKSKQLTLLNTGTIIYSMYASVGKVAQLLIPATTNQAIVGLVNNEEIVLNEYLRFSLESFEPFVNILFSSNTQNNINEEKVKNITIPISGLETQEKIVKFLKDRNVVIEITLKKLNKMIELLKEKRQAIITHAVTKGLDPNVPMKDSGVEWIGNVSERWSVTKIIYYSKLKTGGTPKREVVKYWENGTINWMSSGEINKNIIFDIDEKITKLGYENSNASLLPINSVMIALNGQGKTKGSVGILKIQSTCNQSLAAFITEERYLHYRFLYYHLKSKYQLLRGLVGDNLRDGLSLALLRTLYIPLPKLEEQKRICDYLDQETSTIDSLTFKFQKMTDLLKEYRSTLISAAVTGKIDVRNL